MANNEIINKLIKKLNTLTEDNINKANILRSIGMEYLKISDNDNGLIFLEESLIIFRKIERSSKEDLVFMLQLSSVARLYKERNNLDKYFDFHLERLNVKINHDKNKLKSKTYILCYEDFANLYNEKKDYKTAIEYYEKYLNEYHKYFKDGFNYANILYTYINLGQCYEKINDYKKALEKYLIGKNHLFNYIKIAKKEKYYNQSFNTYFTSLYPNLVSIYKKRKNYLKYIYYNIKLKNARKKLQKEIDSMEY